MTASTNPSWPARLWQRLKAVQHAIATALTVALLFVLYWTVFAAVALVARLSGKDLLQREPPLPNSYWLKREPARRQLADLSRQF
jgi:hypothetical protein